MGNRRYSCVGSYFRNFLAHARKREYERDWLLLILLMNSLATDNCYLQKCYWIAEAFGFGVYFLVSEKQTKAADSLNFANKLLAVDLNKWSINVRRYLERRADWLSETERTEDRDGFAATTRGEKWGTWIKRIRD